MAKQKIEVVIDGKNNAGPAIRQAGAEVDGLRKVVAAAGAAIAGAVSAGAFAGWIKGSIDAAAELDGLARVAGTSTDQFQAWAIGARTVGVSTEQLSDILKDVSDKVGDFLQTGGGELADFFNGIAPQIGVTAEQFRSLSGADALQLYVSSLEKANLSQSEMTFYMEGIANDASLLLPLLENGGAGMAAWAAEAERLGLILGSETIAQAKEFNQQLDTIGLLTSNVGSQIAAEMLPTLNDMAGLLIDVSQNSDVAGASAEFFGIVLKSVATAAIGVGSTLETVGRSLGGLAAAAAAVASGELAQAGEILRLIKADNEAGAAEAEARIRRLWSGEYAQAGQRAVRVNAQVADSQERLVKSSKDYQEQQAAEKKAAEAAAKAADKAAADAARQAEQLAQQQENYVAGLERQAATVGMTADEVRQYELAEQGLASALRERAEAALEVIEVGKRQKKQAEDLAKLQERGAQLQKSVGQNLRGQREQNDAEIDGYGMGASERERIAAERAIRAEYQRYQDELNEATPADLLGSAEYQAQADLIRDGLNAALHENADAWSRSQMAMGDWSRGASEAFANYMTEAQDIAGQTEQMIGGAMESLTQGIGDAFAQAIVYGEDWESVLHSVAQTILSEVISSLVQMGVRYAINAALGQATAAAITATNAALATATAAAWAPAAAAVSLATMGANSAPAIAGMTAAQTAASGFALAPGFATGGFISGPGTGSSDDIPAWLSNGEFVTREAVVSQPGAKAFLESFNAHGMSALDDYARRVKHATGGLAGVPAPSLPAPSLGNVQLAEPAKALSSTVHNAVSLHVYDDPIRIADAAFNSRAGEESFVAMLSKDPAKFRSILGV